MMEKNFKKILLISPSRLGDTIMCTPAIHYLKMPFPHARIDVIALSTPAAEVLVGNPDVEKIWFNDENEQLCFREVDYDLVINIHDSEVARNYLAQMTCKKIICEPEKYSGRHQAEKLLCAIEEALALPAPVETIPYRLFPNLSHVARMKEQLTESEVNLDRDFLIGFHLGCHGLAKFHTRFWRRFKHDKAWPFSSFVALAKRLMKENPRFRIVLTGSQSEAKMGEQFCRKIPQTINLIEKTSVLELAALMSSLKLFVTNDTGALHVACATGVPLIALFGKSDPVSTGPYPRTEKQQVIHRDPIMKISVEEVMERARELI